MLRRLVIKQSLSVYIDQVAVKHVDFVRYLVLRRSPHTNNFISKFSSKIVEIRCFQTLSIPVSNTAYVLPYFEYCNKMPNKSVEHF